MSEEQILQLWRSDYTKHKVAQIYKRIYNEQVKIVRLELRNRHAGKMISTYDALHKVEKVVWKEIKYFYLIAGNTFGNKTSKFLFVLFLCFLKKNLSYKYVDKKLKIFQKI